jgi:predicted MFS family arabinose efflux permease
LSAVQGGVVRRLAGRFDEGRLAATGAAIEIAGFALTLAAVWQVSVPLLLCAITTIVCGFAFMQPNLQSLLSRRSDPSQQGLVLGVGQSVSSLARIAGAGLGIPLLMLGTHVPYTAAMSLMTVGLILVLIAARGGRDYAVRTARESK